MKRLLNIFLLAAMLAVTVTTVSIPTNPAHAAPLLSPNDWNALSSGLNGTVFAVVVSGTDIYVGGQFTDAGGNTNADYIAKWNGTSWSALGSGLNGIVSSIAVRGTDIYVGGSFTDAGGDSNADYVAQWNGSTWSTLGNGLNNIVNVVAVSGSNIYVAGLFTDAGGYGFADYIAKLDGGTWDSLGTTPLNNPVYSAVVAGSNVYVGGNFQDAGGDVNADNLALWDGTSWSALGNSGLNAKVSAIALNGGEVYVGGEFTNAAGNPSADNIAKWDGTSWSALGGGLNYIVRSIAIDGQNVYAGGYFTNAGGDANADYIARWDGASWSALSTKVLDGAVNRITMNGLDLYAGGQFLNIGSNSNAKRIARFEIDTTAPMVNSFAAISPSNSLNIPITTFTASDNAGVTGYLITESDAAPSTGIVGWTVSVPTSYTVGSDGTYTLYPWVKDATGNISPLYGSPVAVTVDATAPTVDSFTTASSSNSLDVPIMGFTASDNAAVTGYLITISATPPSAGAGGWTVSTPATYAVGGDGSYMLYPWAKDAGGNVSAVYGSPANVTVDATKPTVTGFSVPSSSASLNILGISFSSSDNFSVTGFLITESSTPPSADAEDWTASAPTTFTVASQGSHTLYPWAKDAAGNISNVYGSPVTVTVDVTKPVVNSFTVTSPSTSLDIPITAFTASDNIAVSAYLITESSTVPSSGAVGWSASKPTTFTVASQGSHTLYPWVKDTVGNVSAVFGSPRTVSVDTTAPTVTGFSAPASSSSLNIPINTFTASDTVGVTGYLITESSTPPVAGAVGWSASKPTTFTVASQGSHTLYPWAKDAVGHVSSVFGSPASVEVNTSLPGDTTAPSIDTFTTVSTSNSLDIPITSFTASDNVAVTSYLITESATQPASSDSGWTNSASTTYTVASDGGYTLYPWAKDAAGNVSSIYGSPASVEVNTASPSDTTAPAVDTFTADATSNSLNISITAFTASDDTAVTGYLITDSSTPPLTDALGWDASAPSYYTVGADGNYTLYPWAKDAVGHVSSVYGSPVSVEVNTASPSDATPPSVDSFTAPSTSTYSDLSITTFTASDNVAVTGYLITESSTPPSPNDAGWTASAPTRHTVISEGTYTLYPWVKDAAGNVSAVYGSPATVQLNFLPPYIMQISRYYLTPNEVTNADTLIFYIHFWGIVKNIDPSDFVVIGGTTATVTNVSSDHGDSALVMISGGDLVSFNGTVGLDISPSQDIVSDYTGKHLVASVPNPNQRYTMDNIDPAAVHITGNAGVTGATLNYTDGTLKTVTADGSGWYSIAVPHGWSGILTPYKIGYIFTSLNKAYSNLRNNQTAQNYTAAVCIGCADVNALIGGNPLGNYTLGASQSRVDTYALSNGPVEVKSTNSVPVIAAERVIFSVNNTATSYSELMGLPQTQVATSYLFPWYNNQQLNSQLRFGNVGSASTIVSVKIHGVTQATTYTLAPGESTTATFGVSDGPVEVFSDGQNIIAAERVIFAVNGTSTSYSELMGLPQTQVATSYLFPWYNNQQLNSQLRFGNVGTSSTIVSVKIHGVTQATTYTLAPGESTTATFPVSDGPVEVFSDGQNIIAAERVIFAVNNTATSYSELMGLPKTQATTSYIFPWYNNQQLNSQLRFGNVGSTSTIVSVKIHGVTQATTYTLAPGESTTATFGASDGPIEVFSDGQNIIAAERVIFAVNNTSTSYSELMGLPKPQLATSYLFPWYNNLQLNAQLRFGAP